ncbi:MAG TPA: depupylase/deamidase Dop [Actinomycetota bacterium]|jgi:proteasome accessory factor PafA2|nr:depupylase/deamidase Dop [Actinomycetota bacterium]
MAIPKVMGIETEYGIIAKGGEEQNPIFASSLLINSFVSPRLKRVRWDYDEETPFADARGFERGGVDLLEDEGGLVSVILENGARYYVDHAHPEYSTPECSNARDLVIHDKAGERVLAASLRTASQSLPEGQRILVYKNNSDGKGNSYGCHENYLMSRETPFPNIVSILMPFLVTRQVFTGAGKLGIEGGGMEKDAKYQISQRADFFEVEVGLETTFKRPLINTRDEPHADPEKYRRLHVILGDANMSEVATFLKVGTTALVLSMIEDGFMTTDLTLTQPVAALRTISRDPSCRASVSLADGRTVTAVDVQWEYLTWVKKYLEHQPIDEVTLEVVNRWEQTLTALEVDPMSLDRQLDWVAKYRTLDAYRERHGLDWTSSKLAMVDLQYHDIRTAQSIYYKMVETGQMETLVSEEDIVRAVSEPPHDTRAYFRGKVLRRFSSDVTAASWDSIIFDTGSDSLQKVPMLEPLKGTKDVTEALITSSRTSEELIQNLGA